MHSECKAPSRACRHEQKPNSQKCWHAGLPFKPRVAQNDLYPHEEVIVVLRNWARKKNPYSKSIRRRGWRAMLVSAINAGIERKLIGLKPHSRPIEDEDATYQFKIDGIPAIANASVCSRGEVRVHVAFWPTKDAERWVKCSNADFLAGRAFATSWLERTHGPWLQLPNDFRLLCQNGLLRTIADIEVEPLGFLDRGPIML